MFLNEVSYVYFTFRMLQKILFSNKYISFKRSILKGILKKASHFRKNVKQKKLFSTLIIAIINAQLYDFVSSVELKKRFSYFLIYNEANCEISDHKSILKSEDACATFLVVWCHTKAFCEKQALSHSAEILLHPICQNSFASVNSRYFASAFIIRFVHDDKTFIFARTICVLY